MIKKIFPLILVLCIVFSSCFALPANAFGINGYEMHHEAGMVVYLDTDTVIYSKNADKRMYPASITKLMTAIVMVENIPDLENTMIPYTEYANNLILGTGSVVLNLKVGEQINAKDALAALLISSCGDVAYAIAEYVGKTSEGFVDLMNKKAKELGLNNTNFVNPVGLHDDNHYTTARDVYKMAVAAFDYDIIEEFASSSRYTLSPTNMSDQRTIVTSNMLLSYSSNAYYTYAKAGKTGFTSNAGRCLVSTASYRGYTYLAVVLNADTVGGTRYDFVDIANMFRWAFNNFEYKSILEPTTPVTEAPLSLSREFDHLPICFEGGLKTILPKEADTSTISYEVSLTQSEFSAPIQKGTVVGKADVYYAEEKIGTVNLVAGQTIKASPMLVFLNAAKTFLTSSFMKVIYIIIAIIAVFFVCAIAILNRGKNKKRRVKYIPLSKDERDDVDY